MSWLQLKPSYLMIRRGDDVVLRKRQSTKVLLIEDEHVDVIGMCEALAKGIDGDRLCAEFGSTPLSAQRVETIVESLRERGALLRDDDHEALSESQIQWFSRELAYFAEFENETHSRFAYVKKLREAHVLMLGAGSLGSWAMLHMASCGVGKLSVVDHDTLEPSNLARQVAYGHADIGKAKVDAAIDAVGRLTPMTEVRPHRLEITSADDIVALVQASAPVDLIMLTADMPVWQISRWAAAASRRTGIPLLRGNSLGIGPLFFPGETSCPACDWPRLLAAQPDIERTVEFYRDRHINGAAGGAASALSTNLSVAGAVLAQEALWMLCGLRDRCRSVNHRVIIQPTLTISQTPFPRHEHCPECGQDAIDDAHEELQYRDLTPDTCVRVRAPDGVAPFVQGEAVFEHPRLPSRGARRYLAGHGFGLDPQRVRTQAFCELVEHLSAFYAGLDQRKFVQGSIVELESTTLSLGQLRRYRPDQALPPGVGHLRETTPLTWVEARRLGSEEVVRVPALLSFLRWKPPTDEMLFTLPDATGLATRRELDAAVLHGWQECLERDATMLSWKVPSWASHAVSTDVVDPRLLQAAQELGASVELFDVGRPDHPSVILAVVSNEDGSMLTCGSSCRAKLRDAAGHAVEEAVMLRASMIQRADLRDGSVPLHTPRTSFEHVARCFDDGSEVLAWYRGQASRCSSQWSFRPAEHEAMLGEGSLARPLYVDVTDQSARRSGWHVVRVIVPESQPRESNSLAVHWGTSALAPYDATSLNRAPHPFG